MSTSKSAELSPAHAGTLLSIEANATAYPLFALPAEVRNLIYGLVLGSNDIHIGAGGVVYGICTATVSDKQAAENHLNGKTAAASNNWHSRHSPCFQYPPNCLLDLSLLRVSKQIHEEAALIPFTSNTFIFESTDEIVWFAESLLVPQRKLLGLMSLKTWRNSPLHTHQKARIAKLTSLRDLTITVEVHDRDHHAVWTNDLREILEEFQQTFEQQPLKTARVCVRPRFDVQGGEGVPVEWRLMARETEQALLAPWDKEAYKAELDRKRQAEEHARVQRASIAHSRDREVSKIAAMRSEGQKGPVKSAVTLL